MELIRVIYRHEIDGWWAESPEVSDNLGAHEPQA
jgi:hypothetical protein